ncbi:MAG: RnfH family protein [Gammaproteobacteria bacterium]|nr:RnfH family protein [Gammaproteobacteria bacterium]
MEPGGNASVAIRVAYATREEQVIIELSVPDGTTIQDAIRRSGILSRYPDIDLRRQGVGVFGQARALDYCPRTGDRIEIYRRLALDPKEARRKRKNKSFR